MTKIISVDPGNTSGLAIAEVGLKGELLSIEQFEEKLSLAGMLHLLTGNMPDIIVYERFALYQHKSETMINNEFYPVQLIGVIKMYGELYTNKVEMVVQTAAQGKAIWKDDKLKKFSLYHPNSKHCRDAVRHLLTYLNYHRQPEIREQWGE